MMNGLTMCFGGLTSYGITFYSGSFAQWRILYIFLGLLGIAVGIMVLIFLPDSPSTAKFLTPRERLIALERVRDNQSGTVGRKFKMDQCVETLTDIKTWLLLLAVMIFSIPNGGLSNFSAIITRSFGYTAREALLLQVPSGVVAFITTILVTWWAQVKSTRMLPIIACVTPSLFGAALLVGLAGNTALYKGESCLLNLALLQALK
jgi:ACS family allantoate permease-like MFS transporter